MSVRQWQCSFWT